MEILKYEGKNLETISRVVGQPLSEVREDLDTASRLGLEIYSVRNYISFNTLEVLPKAYHVDSKVIDEWYEITGPPNENGYIPVQVKGRPNL